MTAPCFSLDEHVNRAVARGLRLREATIQVYRIGDPTAPPVGSEDPDLLLWIEAHNCLLVTNNRASMPTHLLDHFNAGRHIPGILIIPKRRHIGAVIDDLHLIWAASTPSEYQDQIVYLPLNRKI